MTTTDAAQDLESLLDRARHAGPADRIAWRDPIATQGAAAIDALTPWLASPTLAGFAIRVIERAGANGEQEAAQRVLRGARSRLDVHLRADVDWALRQLRDGTMPASRGPSPAAARVVLRSEAPRYSTRSVARPSRRTASARVVRSERRDG